MTITEGPSTTVEPEDHIMRTMNGKGDTPLKWTPDNADEVRAARDHFNALRAKRFDAYKMDPRHPDALGEKAEQFDPQAGEYMMVPNIQGG